MTGRSFAIWITGLPASGKSTITAALVEMLHNRGMYPLVLESDRMRKILTPEATYSDDERDRFYSQLAALGAVAAAEGIPVLFDATGNRKLYRDRARGAIDRFVEVFVNSPLDVCVSRDPKGIYAAGRAGSSLSVPGIQSLYEPPVQPELILDGTMSPEINADRILKLLETLSYV